MPTVSDAPMTRLMVHEWMNTDILGSRDQGRKLRDRLVEHLRQGNPVTLDFGHIDVMTSAFADECFGKLWDHHDRQIVRHMIHLTGLRGSADA